jgi:hypothetical protein
MGCLGFRDFIACASPGHSGEGDGHERHKLLSKRRCCAALGATHAGALLKLTLVLTSAPVMVGALPSPGVRPRWRARRRPLFRARSQ